jgi:hypothetical protein
MSNWKDICEEAVRKYIEATPKPPRLLSAKGRVVLDCPNVPWIPMLTVKMPSPVVSMRREGSHVVVDCEGGERFHVFDNLTIQQINGPSQAAADAPVVVESYTIASVANPQNS